MLLSGALPDQHFVVSVAVAFADFFFGTQPRSSITGAMVEAPCFWPWFPEEGSLRG